jgi:hypothetical protein
VNSDASSALRRTLVTAGIASLATGCMLALAGLMGACTSGTTPNCGGDAAGTCDPYEAGSDSGASDGAVESSLHGG